MRPLHNAGRPWPQPSGLLMTDRSPGFRRDLNVLLHYRWFIIVVFAVAVVGGVLAGFANAFEYEATSVAEVRSLGRKPVFGEPFAINFEEYTFLGGTERVAERAAGLLTELGRPTEPDDILGSISVRDVTPPGFQAFGLRQVEFKATDGDEDTALAYANAWAQAYVAEAEERRSEVLEEQIDALDQQAQGALDEFNQALEDLTQALQAAPDALVGVPAEALDDRANVARALDRVRTIQSEQGEVSTDQLRVALGDVLPPQAIPDGATPSSLAAGLELQLAALNAEIAASEGDASQDNANDPQTAFARAQAARDTYDEALRQAAAGRASRAVPPVDFRVVRGAEVENSQALGFLGLLAAAAAFGLAVGVVGAFVLDLLDRRGLLPWSRHRETAAERT
ncbi:MAG TPA: hypothetical protein VNL92_07095 [Dehalococcoidia bacterium]|nr:hypothetical protein [Dehalococcoidia bacterium]